MLQFSTLSSLGLVLGREDQRVVTPAACSSHLVLASSSDFAPDPAFLPVSWPDLSVRHRTLVRSLHLTHSLSASRALS